MNLIKYFITGLIFIIKSLIKFIKYFIIGLIAIISIIPYYIIIGIKFIFSKKNREETKEIENKFIPITILTLAITTYLISIFILTRWYVQNERTKYLTNDLIYAPIVTYPDDANTNQYEDETPPAQDSSSKPSNEENIQNKNPSNQTTNTHSTANTNFINVNLNSYIQKNPETVAWIQVNGTKVNYPVVKHKDNDYYLNHDFNKKKTKNGWIFADYRNNFETFDNNTIIYGHNLIKDKMFGSLPNILYNNNWYSNKNNHYIKLSTKNTNTVWQIFSIYKIAPTTDYLQTKFNSVDAYNTLLTTLKNRSKYKFDVELNYTDKIITLSTCDDTGTKRVVIHAKLINIESK